MKKLIFSLTFILGSSSLFANSHIGDRVVLEGNAYGTFPMKITQEVMSFDSTANTYSVDSTTEVAGTTTVDTTEEETVWSHSNAMLILGSCAQANGVAVQLKLMGTSHMTCKVESTEDMVRPLYRSLGLIPGRGTFVWIGDFPVLGAGKIESDIYTMEATEINWAE